MTRRLPFWIAAAVLLIGAWLVYDSAEFSSRSGDAAPLYSTRRHDPYGTAALHDFARERGLATRTVERATLHPDDTGTLVQVIAGPVGKSWTRGPDYHLQTNELADWIARGNTVLQFSRTTTELMDQFKILPAKQVAGQELEAVQKAETRGDAPDTLPGVAVAAKRVSVEPLRPTDRMLSLRSPMTFAERPHDAAWTVLARAPLDHNAIVAAEYRIGVGRLILVGAPTPALNGTLDAEGNLDFLLTALGDRPVLFDEWSHGIGHQATVIGFLHDAGLLPLLLQIAFVIALFVWSTSARRPRDDESAPPRARSSAEQISTLGYLYGRSLGPDAAFERINSEVARRLSDALRCRPQDIATRVAKLAPAVRDRYQRIVDRLSPMRPAGRARCRTCGYDLRGTASVRCPECGATIDVELRQRIAESDLSSEPNSGRRPLRTDAAFADVLSWSHQLSQEIRRDSRVVK